MARQISTRDLTPGMRLGRALYDEHGHVLLQRGVELRGSYIKRVQERFAVVMIDDDGYEDISVEDTVPGELRNEMQVSLLKEWTRIAQDANFEKITLSKDFARSLRDQVRNLLTIAKDTKVIQEDLSSLASYDNSTYVHSVNVAIYALLIGDALKLPESMLMELGIGALLHDIGKLWIPVDILQKPAVLTDAEMALMRSHAAVGHDVLSRQGELSYLVAHCAFQHHERLDGSGYPRALAGNDIHQFGKILAVADIYDSMVMHRPYRAGISPSAVMEYLFSKADTELDLQLVAWFSQRVAMYPVGAEVTLSTRQTAVVSHITPSLPARPVVRIIRDPDGQRVPPYDLDLSTSLNVTITGTTSGITVLDIID
ncbi:MAG: HD-GYP domain-containing protein [Firmicutes bacterium]|nr:HD-GYP domain-containing protein [Bacillota bacterium]